MTTFQARRPSVDLCCSPFLNLVSLTSWKQRQLSYGDRTTSRTTAAKSSNRQFPTRITWKLFLLLSVISTPVNARTILVTGAAGFVGSHLAEALLGRGDAVVVVDEVNDYYDVRIKEGNLKLLKDTYGDQVTIYRGDICDQSFMDEIFERHGIDDIAHMAARAGVRPSILDPFVYVHSNIKGTIVLLDRAVKYNVTNFVYASSSSVYGGSKSTYFSELEKVDRPISPYAATKKSCELFAYAYHRNFGIHTTGLRFFTVYGPRGRPDMAVWKFIDRVTSGKVIQQYGNGTSSRDYTYISDIVNGVVRALDRPMGYRVYNLGKGSGTKLKDLMEMIESQVGKKANVELLPDQPGDVPYTCANVSSAYQALGYNASFPTVTGVAKTVEWFKETYPAGATSLTRRRNLQRVDVPLFDDEMHQLPSRRRTLKTLNRSETRKTVLVTGGAKFLGSHVADAILDRGDRVVLVDELTNSEQSKNNLNLLVQQYGDSGRVMVYLGNLTDSSFLRKVFETERPKFVCHLAGDTEDRGLFSESIRSVQRNIDPTLHLLELSKGKSHGAFDVENFIILSSAKVYGKRSQDVETLLGEDDRVDSPLTPFAASKKSEELLAFTYHHLYNIPVSILRVDSMYGPQHDYDSQSFDLFHQFLQNLTSNAEDDVSWVYVGDVTSSVLKALDQPHEYEIFNVGGRNCPQTLKSVFQMMDKNLLGIGGSETFRPCSLIEKAKVGINFRPSVTLLEGVMETIRWHRGLFDYSQTSIQYQSKASTPQVKLQARINTTGWEAMRNIALIQWAIVVVVVMFRLCKGLKLR